MPKKFAVLTMPVWHVLVSDARSDVEHDDTTLAVDIIAIPQPAKFLLSCCVPDIKLNASIILIFPNISKIITMRGSAIVAYRCEG